MYICSWLLFLIAPYVVIDLLTIAIAKVVTHSFSEKINLLLSITRARKRDKVIVGRSITIERALLRKPIINTGMFPILR